MEIKLYRTFEKDLEPKWNALLAESSVNVPFLRFDYLNTWWQTRGGGEWPDTAELLIITAWQGNELIGIAPFFRSEWEGANALLLLGSIEISDYLDLIARPADLPAFTELCLKFLADQTNGLPEWQRMELYNVLENSPSIHALDTAARSQGWVFRQEPFRPALAVSLPGDWETYLAGIDKKQRHEIRRKIRRAYSAQLPVRWYIVREEEKLEDEINGFLELMAQDPEKARFLTPLMRENFRLTIRCAFQANYLHLSFLEIDGQKAASYFSFDYLNQLWVYNSGINAAFNEYSPGWVLLGELLKWANENGRKVFDFMRGDEDYKFRFGAQKRDVMRVSIIKP